MPSYEEKCLEGLRSKKLKPPCDELPVPSGWPHVHCIDMLNMDPAMHDICQQEGVPYLPIPTLACVRVENGEPKEWKYYPEEELIEKCTALGGQWKIKHCYCCCSCFAYGTLISTPGDQFRTIQTLATGDQVLAGWRPAGDGSPEWKPTPLTFSQGVERESDQAAVYLAYGDGDAPDDMVCSGDQPLMLTNGKLIRACQLQRGDELMRVDGSTAEVLTIAIGEYRGGVHHIGTGLPMTGEDGKPLVDGHLIGAGGLVAGDYFLQLHLPAVDSAHVDEEVEARPELGTPEYAEANESLQSSVGMLFGEPTDERSGSVQVQTGRFTVFSGQSSVEGPTASLLTREQANDVLTNGSFTPLSQTLPKALVDTIFAQLRGFFPEVVFYLDWLDMQPNVHAVEAFGQKAVVITGGLARLVDFGYAGLLFAICAGLGRFSNLEPRGLEGFAGTGTADYWAFAVPPRRLLAGLVEVEFSLEGLEQFETLFALVDPKDGEGNPDDPVNEPSLACRTKTIKSAIAGGSVPPCAGGPPAPLVELNAVVATPGSAYVYLSTPPTPESAEDPAHYTLSPKADITSAKMSPDTNLVVVLDVDLEKDAEYELTISDIKSPRGGGVDPTANSVRFKVSAEER